MENPAAVHAKFSRRKIFWLIAILFSAVLLILVFVFPPGDAENIFSQKPQRVDEALLYSQSADDPKLGNPNAKARLVEFGDFQCPYCRASFPVVREILQKYQGKIYFVYRDFPLFNIHPDSIKAAEAAGCAANQDKFWAMHDKLFINQENLLVSDLKQYASEIGLNVAAFNQCLDSGQQTAEVEGDYNDGIVWGVKATPTFFLNGYRIPGSIPRDVLIRLIDQALEEE